MATTSTTRRRGFLVVLALGTALAAGGCGATQPTADPAAAPPVVRPSATAAPATTATDGTGAFVAPPPRTNPGPTKIAASFPGTARAYAEAVVEAWTQNQMSVLGSLTTAGVQEQILEIPQPLNDAWTYLRCDGTAGSSYCMFANADGDELTLRISHALLGKPHGAIEVRLDLTEYPIDGIAYVKEFVGAWQIGNTSRMLKLSKPIVVDEVNAAPLNPTYPAPVCCGGGLLQIKVHWTGSRVRFDVGTTLLGDPHAIIGYASEPLAITQG